MSNDDETPRERAARRLLAIAALEKLITAEKAALRREEGAAFTRPGQREVAELPDGTPLGNVRLDRPTEGFQVTDSAALLEWAAENYPEHIRTVSTEVLSEAFTKALLAELKSEGQFVNRKTGEILPCPPGVAYVVGTPKLVVTTDKAAPAAVRRALGQMGSVLGLRELEAS